MFYSRTYIIGLPAVDVESVKTLRLLRNYIPPQLLTSEEMCLSASLCITQLPTNHTMPNA